MGNLSSPSTQRKNSPEEELWEGVIQGEGTEYAEIQMPEGPCCVQLGDLL